MGKEKQNWKNDKIIQRRIKNEKYKGHFVCFFVKCEWRKKKMNKIHGRICEPLKQ